MKWFKSHKKKSSEDVKSKPVGNPPDSAPAFRAAAHPESDVVVYGLEEDGRSQALRDLLRHAGVDFRDERVDEDLGMRAWLQRLTGNDALPKLFVGVQCYGTYEDIEALALQGKLRRILDGRSTKEELDRKRLKAEMSVASIIQLLQEEESLVVNEGGAGTETWLEPPHKPHLILFEGEPHPIAEMQNIVTQIVERFRKGEITLAWRSDQE